MKSNLLITALLVGIIGVLMILVGCTSADIKLPKTYGIYIVSSGKMIDLGSGPPLSKRYKSTGLRGKQGINTLSGINVQDKNLYFIVYYKEIDPTMFKLAKLKYIKNNDIWIKETLVPIKVEPINGKDGMYRLTPDSLSKGTFALYAPSDFEGVLACLQLFDGSIFPNSVWGLIAFCDFAVNHK